LPAEEKALIAMWRAGKSWRGWFPEGGEYTSGTPDGKEGIYFGTDLPPDHKSVALGVPLHGPNLYPASVPELATLVSEYMACATRAAQRVLAAISSALCGDTDWLHDNVTSDPTVLFRVFQYPSGEREWGVGEHTDYGLLTLLYQDNSGGLEVHTPTGWIEAPPITGTLVCNLGDMLERMTGGAYRSTPHRVRATRGGERISFPLFLDPNWHWRPREIPGIQPTPRYRSRWDDADPLEWTGTYGEYLTAKVAKVFPQLFADYVSG
jgi:isopenicillin N synthase-like dioxygenase